MKKIKKDTIVPPKANPKDLIQYLKLDEIAETIEQKRKVKKVVKKRVKKEEAPVDHWIWSDFMKYYLSVFENVVGFKDSNYIEINFRKAIREKSRLNITLELYFGNNKKEMREYIEWAIKWWMSDKNDFLTGAPKFWVIFNEKGTVIKKYFDQGIEERKPNKKNRRFEMDNKMADNNAWKDYLEEE